MNGMCWKRMFGLALGMAVVARGSDLADPRTADLGEASETEAKLVAELVAGQTDIENHCNIVLAARDNAPRLALNTRGPGGVVRDLAFSPDSARLYSAGFDKAVQVWGLDGERRSIRRTAANNAVLAQTLRWELARGVRGAVYALAASPVDRKLAMAGFSARDANGDIVLYDTARAQVLAALRGHESQAVVALDFSPDGKRLLSVGQRGEVRLWTLEPAPTSVVVRPTAAFQFAFQPAKFLSNETFVVAVPADASGSTWRLAEYSINQLGQPRTLNQTFEKQISRIAVERGGDRYAVADGAGSIYICKKDEARLLRKDRVALDLDFAPGNRLFVATRITEFNDNGKTGRQAVLENWDLGANRLLDQVQTSKIEHNFVCRVSPDGLKVVTSGGDNENELWIYTITDRQGQALENPLQQPPLTLRGVGRKVWKVAFADGDQPIVGFGADAKPESERSFNQYANISAAFDLTKIEAIALSAPTAPKLTWRSPDVADWEVRIDPARLNVSVLKSKQAWSTIALRPEIHGSARSYCLIPNPTGAVAAIAIGTDTNEGIFIFGLGEQGQPGKLLRYLRDHNGFVTSVSVSKDGKFLASSSIDQTVKIWSLEGLWAPGGEFANEAAWGGSFALRDGKVVLASALQAGATLRRGLFLNDTIVEATFGATVAKSMGRGDSRFDTANPADILAGIKAQPLHEPLVLTVERKGTRLNRRILLVPAWEPLLTLFVDNQGEWATWTPQGYYDASVNGDELFGWLLNRGVETTPSFYRADQFRNEFERPAVLRGLLKAGSLPNSLRLNEKGQPKDANTVLQDQMQQKPNVVVEAPLDAEEIKGDKVNVVARIEYPNDDQARTANSVVYVNGIAGKVLEDKMVGSQRTLKWQVNCSDVYNRVRVMTEEPNPDRMTGYADVHFRLRSAEAPPKPKLHMFTLAAGSKYKHVEKLQFPVADANAVTKAIKEQSGALYVPGKTVALTEDQITRDSVDKAIDQWTRELSGARGDDLLIVFIAGHGVAIENEYYFVTTESDVSNLAQAGIRWAQLRRLASLPCRKVVMMDTCHSGSVLPTGAPQNMKSAIRPLKRDEILVLSATDIGQEAAEDPALGHGVFTMSVLDGLAGGADYLKDGAIEIGELARFVAQDVPRRFAAAGQKHVQTPRSSPTDLLEMISLPLVSR